MLNSEKIKNLRKLISSGLLFCLLFSFSVSGYGWSKEEIQDNVIASTLKTLAKKFIANSDLEKLKQANITKINNFSNKEFVKMYNQIHQLTKDLPDKFIQEYQLSSTMSKSQAIANIKSLDKKKIKELIDALPNKAVAGQFRSYIRAASAESKNKNLVGQINDVWSGISRRLTSATKAEPVK